MAPDSADDKTAVVSDIESAYKLNFFIQLNKLYKTSSLKVKRRYTSVVGLLKGKEKKPFEIKCPRDLIQKPDLPRPGQKEMISLFSVDQREIWIRDHARSHKSPRELLVYNKKNSSLLRQYPLLQEVSLCGIIS